MKSFLLVALILVASVKNAWRATAHESMGTSYG